MSWKIYSCYICAGLKNIEIGRNIDNQQEKIESCPACYGKGYLGVINNPYEPLSGGFYKRMIGLDIKGDNNEKPN